MYALKPTYPYLSDATLNMKFIQKTYPWKMFSVRRTYQYQSTLTIHIYEKLRNKSHLVNNYKSITIMRKITLFNYNHNIFGRNIIDQFSLENFSLIFREYEST